MGGGGVPLEFKADGLGLFKACCFGEKLTNGLRISPKGPRTQQIRFWGSNTLIL